MGFNRHPIWLHQAYHNLTAKYKRTIFGTLWVTGSFLFTSISIAIVFSTIFGQNLREFLPYCLTGTLIASLFLSIITEGPELFMMNAPMIKNNAVPFTYYAFENLAKSTILFLHNLAVYYILMVIFQDLTIPNPLVVPGLILMVLIIFPWSMLVGMLAARFRDIRYLLPNFSTFLFFVTPIYWKPSALGERGAIAEFNPLYHMISILREPVLGRAPTLENWIWSVSIAALGIALWLLFFSWNRRKIPFWV